MNDIGYAPLRYYWIIEYENGDAVAQFDPETGQENLWKSISKDNMVKASLAEFTTELSDIIIDGCGVQTIPSMMPDVVGMELEPGDTLILLRRNYVRYAGSGLKNRRTEYILGKNGTVVYTL